MYRRALTPRPAPLAGLRQPARAAGGEPRALAAAGRDAGASRPGAAGPARGCPRPAACCAGGGRASSASVGQLAEARRRLQPLLRRRRWPCRCASGPTTRLRAIDEDERALALADWPEAPLPPGRGRRAPQGRGAPAGRARCRRRRPGAVGSAPRHPTSSGARFLRARALEALARHDEARRELIAAAAAAPLARRGLAAAGHHAGRARRRAGGRARRRGAGQGAGARAVLGRSAGAAPEGRPQAAGPRPGTGGARGQPATVAARAGLLDEAQRWIGPRRPLHGPDGAARGAGRFARVRRGGGLAVLSGRRASSATTVQALWNDGEALAPAGHRAAEDPTRRRGPAPGAALAGSGGRAWARPRPVSSGRCCAPTPATARGALPICRPTSAPE